MNLIAGTMQEGVDGIEDRYVRKQHSAADNPTSRARATGSKTVTIGNITMDFSGLGAGITDFQSFAKALTSPEGRALIRQVFGEELYKVLETGVKTCWLCFKERSG